jgi:hypothetical protein
MPARREFAFLGAVALVLLALYVGEGLVARGIYNDDDIGHYLIARDAGERPELFLNLWGRPLFTLVYALPAKLGFGAVRVVTAAVTALAVVATGLAGAGAGISAPVAGGLLGTMPFVLLLSYSSLTEPLAALVVALALHAWFARRATLALLLAGLVPLARLELGVVAGLGGIAYIATTRGPGRWRGLLVGTFVLGWAVVGAAVYRDPTWFAAQVFTGEENLYGHTGFWHYLRGLIFVVGPVVFLFLLVDLAASITRRRSDLLSVLPGLIVMLYVLLSWKLSLGHAAGFLRHLVAPAPVFALAAGRGMAEISSGGVHTRRALLVLAGGAVLVAAFLSRALVMHHRAEGPFELARITAAVLVLVVSVWVGRTPHPKAAPSKRDGAARGRGGGAPRPGAHLARRAPLGAALLLAIALLYAVTAEPPLKPDPEQEAVLALSTWFAGSEWAAAPVIASHPWFLRELAASGRLPAGGVPLVKRSAIEAAPPGTVIIWDSHYSIRPPEGMQLRDFKFDPRFRLLRESIATNRRFAAYAIAKSDGAAGAAAGALGGAAGAAATSPPPRYDGRHDDERGNDGAGR